MQGLGNPTAMALGVLATTVAIFSIVAVYYFFVPDPSVRGKGSSGNDGR